MSLSQIDGPLIVGNSQGLVSGTYNPDLGPSAFVMGTLLPDLRLPIVAGGAYAGGFEVLGWCSTGDMMLVDAVPSQLSTTAIAAAQVPVAGTKLNLVSASGAGITVLSAATQIFPAGNYVPKNALAIDGVSGIIAFGQTGAVGIYDPSKALARNIQIASVGNDSTATFVVSGYDIYGYPMNETITGANAGTAVGKKAFKFVVSITPAGTLSGSNVSVGQGDKYGFPMRLDTFGYSYIVWNNASIASTATGTFAFADTTSPATATTGDVRGTYLPASASDGAKRIQIGITPSITNIQTTVGLAGVTQF